MSLKSLHVAPETLSRVTKSLGITALDQWYYISHYTITKAIGTRSLKQFGGNIVDFLKSAYPHHQFDEDKLTSRRAQEKDQRFIEVLIRKLFPNTEILTKARKAVGIVNPETDAYLEIDFWMPSLKLGIEYQDKHHYGYQWYANGALDHYQKLDNIKKDAMPALGYTLVTIGFWWDKTLESLATTIRKFRPDLLSEYKHISAEPIPPNPPPGYISESPVIPGVPGLMSPFIPTHTFNPVNWYAGEKLDGIRGVFNHTLKAIFSRSGNELSILESLLRDVPNMLVEGEIVAGRDNYNKTAAISYHTPHSKVNWPMFRYVVFDIPDSELGNYTQRYSAIMTGLSTHHFIFTQLAFRLLLVDKAHLKSTVDLIIADAGEGAIVQKDAPYEYGRATGLAKIKVQRDDDAQVVRVNEFSCTCKLVSGDTSEIIFRQGFDPSELKIGDIVSFYYKGYSQSGQPKKAEIYKIRYDLTWEKLVSDSAYDLVKKRAVKEAVGSRALIAHKGRNKKGFWNKSQNVRKFFAEFAKTSGFDPLVPVNWYPVTHSSLLNAGGSSMLKAYNYSIKKALSTAYPELKFRKEFRSRASKGYWQQAPNLRAFFDKFAREAEFDPLVAENWNSVKYGTLLNAGGGLLHSHGFNIKNALSIAYPDLKFDNFRTYISKGHWTKSQNVRDFFDEFAGAAGFDPLVPDNWYPVRKSTLQRSGASGLLSAYSYNLNAAISHAYPELKFEEKFSPNRRLGV